MFYVEYPVTLAKSLLSAIPKKGNLMLPKNYRGIQMLAALGALYDRIIANRLRTWSGINYEQSAFQKGKSTIHQIFTIRLLIEIAKRTDTTLYIGFFDLEKAFDKVSRYLLLKKLIKLGIGNCMLQALKRIYSFTSCVLSVGSHTSAEFQTSSGIRQGAPSSVLLFILFMDDLISYLRHHCIAENIIDVMHCLLHADDTAILSTDRDMFIIKCNLMLKYFKDNSLSLNFTKSSYLIINSKANDVKCDLQLTSETLEYKPQVTYLGVIISDTGSLRHDIEKYVEEKRSNITIKYNNFIRKNFTILMQIKIKVLDICVGSTLVYGCESWGNANIPSIETAYRLGLKRALSVRETTNTEIVYLEASRCPLSSRIAKQQLSFWLTLKSYLEVNPEHPLKRLIEYGKRINISYLKFYQNLENMYQTPNNCQKSLSLAFNDNCKTKIRRLADNDGDSRSGVYLQVNPQLLPPTFDTNMFEIERVTVSRYRCGSHNLKIETGRLNTPKIPREERICVCNTGVQSLNHCLFACPLLEELHNEYRFNTIEEAMQLNNIADFFMKMERILNISK